ncbi:MAG: tetratricopeptide repeat protein, partial [Deltaproteobacteria bacterium]|nr:tetratricopeptide repeat protein [Deltaproteobacteria bacterium]
LDEAIKHYTKAIRIKPDYARAHNGLGNALSRQGRLDDAVKHYSAALRYNPNDARAQAGLKRTLRKLDKSSKTGDTAKKPQSR